MWPLSITDGIGRRLLVTRQPEKVCVFSLKKNTKIINNRYLKTFLRVLGISSVGSCGNNKQDTLISVKVWNFFVSRTSFKLFGRKFNLWSWIGPSVCTCHTALHLLCFTKLGEAPGDYFWKFAFSWNFPHFPFTFPCFGEKLKNEEMANGRRKLFVSDDFIGWNGFFEFNWSYLTQPTTTSPGPLPQIHVPSPEPWLT